MMKTLLLLIIGVCPMLISAQNNPNFTIKGSVEKLTQPISMVYILYEDGARRVSDSANVVNDRYCFEGNITAETMAEFRAKPADGSRPGDKDIVTVFLQPGEMKFTSEGFFGHMEITGSKVIDDDLRLAAALKPFEDQNLAAWIAQPIDKKKIGEIDSQKKEEYKKFARANPSSPISLIALERYGREYIKNPREIKTIFDAFSADIKNSSAGKAFAKRLEIALKTDVGLPAIAFVMNTPDGNPVSLSSFRGKYVLIDVWASFCGPCRAKHPGLIKLWNEYEHKGFDILGVSYDKSKDSWLKAIEKDKLPWIQVSDLQGSKSAIVHMYESHLSNLLIDPEGNIMAKNLTVDDLGAKLEELLK